ncbi:MULTISPECIES: glycosyltransferase family 4 protein [Polaromonas]|uniref:Glycosyltransferase family 4 protein n=1 Tax=Polaromonas aquatica TaxID=332657 RepID=A0ABW1U1U1_9BURK
MRVLIWTQHFWPENFLINDLAAALARKGHEVTILTGKPNYPEGSVYPGYVAGGVCHELHDGLRIVRIPILPRRRGSAMSLALNYLSFIASGYIVAPFVLRKEKFDAVFVYATSPVLQALPAIFLAWMKRASMTVWVQDLWPESLRATGFVRSPMLLSWVGSIVRYIYRRADSILIQSEAFRASVERLSAQPGKIHYFPNIVAAGGHPVARGTDLGSSEADLVSEMRRYFAVVFAGNIGRAQSCETILAAAERLGSVTDIRFYIVGAGSQAAFIAQEIVRRKLPNVFMTGQMPALTMPSLFEATSALLVTLADDPVLALTVPSKLQAYFAAGKPIVASVNGEAGRVVGAARAGLVCGAEDGGALADRVLRLYKMPPEDLAQLGANGIRYFEQNFDMNARVCELSGMLESLQGRRPA